VKGVDVAVKVKCPYRVFNSKGWRIEAYSRENGSGDFWKVIDTKDEQLVATCYTEKALGAFCDYVPATRGSEFDSKKAILVLPVSNLGTLEELKDVITNPQLFIKVWPDKDFELLFK